MSKRQAEPCRHRQLRQYEFGCDGARYLAIECEDCPSSTSLLIEDYRGEIDPKDFNKRLPPTTIGKPLG